MPSPAFTPSQRMTLDRALALHQGGRPVEARALYQSLLRSHPRNPDLLGLLGTLECQLGQLETGARLFEAALDALPGQPKVLLNLATALQKLGRFEAARDRFEALLELLPDLPEAAFGLGHALRGLGRPEEALAAFDRVVALRPDHAEAWNNRGILLKDLLRFEEALVGFRRATALRPGHAEAHYNGGIALMKLNRLDEALAAYDRALALRPDFADARWNQALCHLLRGDFAAGLPTFEARWQRREGAPPRPFEAPLWLGESPLEGRTLLIHPEQGLGDYLQYVRYALLARQAGARVVLEAPPPLRALLASLGPDFQVVPEGEPLPPFDCHCPIMSLPLAFGTRLETIPAPVPYLAADSALKAQWEARLGPRTRARVGLFWTGNRANPNHPHRSLPLASLAPLMDLSLSYHALEKDLSEADGDLLATWPQVHTHPGCPKDFPHTAALIEALDLVVTVDSSIAHLAGALGKETWILLPATPDHRWMLERTDSPWYPTATLFRQRVLTDWSEVVAQVADRLGARFPN